MNILDGLGARACRFAAGAGAGVAVLALALIAAPPAVAQEEQLQVIPGTIGVIKKQPSGAAVKAPTGGGPKAPKGLAGYGLFNFFIPVTLKNIHPGVDKVLINCVINEGAAGGQSNVIGDKTVEVPLSGQVVPLQGRSYQGKIHVGIGPDDIKPGKDPAKAGNWVCSLRFTLGKGSSTEYAVYNLLSGSTSPPYDQVFYQAQPGTTPVTLNFGKFSDDSQTQL